MLDIKLIRKEKDVVEAKLKTKEPEIDLSEVVELDKTVRHMQSEIERLQALRNEKSQQAGEKKRKGESIDAIMAEVRTIGDQISSLSKEYESEEKKFEAAMSKLPNLPFDDVKVSQDKEDNVVMRVIGEKPTFSFTPKNHVELNEKLKVFDFHKTSKTTGANWPAYCGIGAKLELALINYMLEIQELNGFEIWLPPLLVRPEIMFGSGQMPKFEGQFYEVKDDENKLFLIPTAEVILNGLHYDEILPEESLPIKYAAFTPCFRREAGAAGKQERGMIRVHQFNKVEMFCFTKPEKSDEMQEHMISVAEEILKGLGLHYRVMKLVTGDMSFTAARTVDIEVWLPGQNRYYEVSSVSTCTDFQARRSKIRYRTAGGKPTFVHTLNGSGLATSRLMVALLENNQNEDGSVTLPPILAEKVNKHVLR